MHVMLAAGWPALAALGTSSPSLRFRTKVGCQHWGAECPVPGFVGTDSSPALSPAGGKGQLATIGSYDSHLYAVEVATGAVRWKVKGAGGEGSPAWSVRSDAVLTWGGLQGSSLDSLDGQSGDRRWRWTPPGGGDVITSSGGLDEARELIFVGTSSTRMLYAVNVSSGATVWSLDAGGEMWSTLGPLLSSTGADGGGVPLVCVGVGGAVSQSKDCAASVLCVHRETGAVVWRARTGKQIQSRPSLGGGGSGGGGGGDGGGGDGGGRLLFVGDYDGCVYAMDASTGTAAWKTCTGGLLEGSSVVVAPPAPGGNHEELVVVSSYDGAVYAMRATDGSVRWRTALGAGPIASTPVPSADARTLYVGGQQGMHALDAASGAQLWNYTTGSLVGSSPALTEPPPPAAGGTALLTFGCEDGYLYGLDVEPRAAPRRHETVAAVAVTAAADNLPLLFMDETDIVDVRGLARPVANSVTLDSTLRAPPLDFAGGAIVFGCLQSPAAGTAVDAPAMWEVYAANTTGIEPVPTSRHGERAAAADDADDDGDDGRRSKSKSKSKKLKVQVWRFETSDFRTYSAPPVLALSFDSGGDPYPYSMPTVKSLARSDATGETILVVFGNGINVFRSSDGGRSFAPTVPSGGPNFDDKDDINVMWDEGTQMFVDMQITKQNWSLPYCDNLNGCDHRRVVSARTSADGVAWSDDLGLRVPDPGLDPPELQFYRLRPFYLGFGSGRLVAHTLLYAPGPWINDAYGRKPPNCQKAAKGGDPHACHAPHMYEEWWLGPPRGGNTSSSASSSSSSSSSLGAADVAAWRRPYRETAAAPRDAWLMAQPANVPALADGSAPRHVWVADGAVYTLPQFRVAGIYAPANVEFSTPPFTLPTAAPSSSCRLTVNADAKWGALLQTGGCDEGCAAYLLAELRDAASGKPLPGFERGRFVPIVNATGLALPLLWQGAPALPAAGAPVFLRFFFRDTTVYSVAAACGP